jgi:hypothetical protein
MGILDRLTNAVGRVLRREDVTRIVQIVRLFVYGDTERPASR